MTLFLGIENSLYREKHVFQRVPRKRKCTGCYQGLRKIYKSHVAALKVKKVFTECSLCRKALCLKCFNEKHLITAV